MGRLRSKPVHITAEKRQPQGPTPFVAESDKFETGKEEDLRTTLEFVQEIASPHVLDELRKRSALQAAFSTPGEEP